MYIAMLLALGLGIGTLSSLIGIGGGTLLVPILLYMGLSPSKTVGTSFLVVLIIGIFATLAHGKLGHIDYKLALIIGAGAIVGTQIGARLLVYVPEHVFTKLFACVMIVIAISLFFKK